MVVLVFDQAGCNKLHLLPVILPDLLPGFHNCYHTEKLKLISRLYSHKYVTLLCNYFLITFGSIHHCIKKISLICGIFYSESQHIFVIALLFKVSYLQLLDIFITIMLMRWLLITATTPWGIAYSRNQQPLSGKSAIRKNICV